MYASGKRYCYKTLMHHSTPLHSPNNALHSPTYGFDVEWMSINRCPPTRSTPARSTPTKSTPTRSTPTRSTSHQINSRDDNFHQINFPPDQLPRGLLPPDQLPTRSTRTRSTPTRSTSHQINSHEVYSHQINFPPDQLPWGQIPLKVVNEMWQCLCQVGSRSIPLHWSVPHITVIMHCHIFKELSTSKKCTTSNIT